MVIAELNDVVRDGGVFGRIQLEETVIFNMIYLIHEALKDRVADVAMVDDAVQLDLLIIALQ